MRISTVGEGTIVFDEVSYTAGDAISGSFTGIVMERDDPDDTIRISMDDGVFNCLAK